MIVCVIESVQRSLGAQGGLTHIEVHGKGLLHSIKRDSEEIYETRVLSNDVFFDSTNDSVAGIGPSRVVAETPRFLSSRLAMTAVP